MRNWTRTGSLGGRIGKKDLIFVRRILYHKFIFYSAYRIENTGGMFSL